MVKHVFAILGARFPNDKQKNQSRCVVCDMPEQHVKDKPIIFGECRGYPMGVGTAQAKHDGRERKRKALRRRLKREVR